MKFLKGILNYSLPGLGALVFMFGLALLFSSSSNAAVSESFWIEGNVKEIKSVDEFDGEFVESNKTLLSEIEEEARYYEVQGEYVDEYKTYKYDYTITKTAEEDRAVVATPYAYNKKENKILIKVGISNNVDDLTDQEGVTTATSESEHKTLDKQSDNVGIMASSTRYFRTKWIDPVALQVNKVETEMTFNYNGSSVTSYTARDRREWLTATGWSESSHSLSDAFVDGRNAQAKTKSTMRNSAFCVGQPTTYVYYNTNNITVYYNGVVSGDVSTYASGGCSSWLSYRNALM